MVELLPSRRRAEEFARALEGDARTDDPRLQRLLDTVSTLSAVPVVEPRREFRDSLRRRLVETAADLPAQARGPADPAAESAARPGTGAAAAPPAVARHAAVTDSPRAARRRRRLVAAATGLVLVGAGGGVAAASEQALPGDVLYPVKRTLETAQVTLAQGSDGEARALLQRASTRLEEAQDLGADASYSATDVEAVEAALHDFASDASGGGQGLLDSYAATGDRADLRTLRDFTARSHQILGDLRAALPAESRPALVSADETVLTLDGLAVRACPGCTSGQPPLGLPIGPVSLPTLPTPPEEQGHQPRTPATTRDTGSGPAGQPDRSDDPRRHRATARDTASPSLPDLNLDRQAPRRTAEPGEAPSDGDPNTDGSRDGQPLLRLDDVLGNRSPETTQPPRTTDVPGVDGDGVEAPRVDDVTDPLLFDRDVRDVLDDVL